MGKSKKFRGLVIKIVLIIFIIFSFTILFESLSKEALAIGFINTKAIGTEAGIAKNTAGETGEFNWAKAWEKLMEQPVIYPN